MTDLSITQSDIANAMKTSFLWDKERSFWGYLAKKLLSGYNIKDENKGCFFSIWYVALGNPVNLDNFVIFLSLCSHSFYKLAGSKAIWSNQILSVSFFMPSAQKKLLENFISYSNEVKSEIYHFTNTYSGFSARTRQQFYLWT